MKPANLNCQSTLKPTAPHTVFVIKDDPDVAELLCLLLQDAGLRTIHAGSAAEGMNRAVTEQPNLILLDVDLPDGNGFDLCRRLKTQAVTSKIPVVFCTGRPDARQEALAAGGVDCLLKPEDMTRVARRVVQLLVKQQHSTAR